ncbi:MAG: restriction endonuclease subunit S [Acidimicrobiales bacterium]
MTQVSTTRWKSTTAGELGVFKGGSGFALRFQGQLNGEYPFFKVSDMNLKGNEIFMTRANNYVTELMRTSIGAAAFPAGAIVFAKVGAAVFLERKRILSQPSCIDNNMAAFVVDPRIVDSRFIYYALTNFRLGSLVAVGALPSLNGKQLRSIPILFPLSVEVQKQISEVLSDGDNLIKILERQLTKLRDIKQGMIQELLTGRTRLPGFNGDWIQATAGELGTFKGGSGFPTRYQGVGEGVYPFFKVSDMNLPGNETSMKTANNYITEPVRAALGATAFPMGSVTFAKVGAAVFLERKRILSQPSCIDNNMAAFLPNARLLDSAFAYFALINFPLSSLVAVGALPSLNGTQLRSITLNVPTDLEEQRAIAQVLSDAEEEFEVLERRLGSARAIKQGMMQELLTGRTRLPVEEAVA